MTSVSAIVAAVGVLVGVVLTVLELRNLVKQRQTDLFMKVYSIFGSGKFSKAVRRLLATEVKNYDDFCQKTWTSSFNRT